MQLTPLELALKHVEELQDKNWIRLEIKPDGNVTLDYGPIHTDGTYERAIATRQYVMTSNGNAEYTQQIHP